MKNDVSVDGRRGRGDPGREKLWRDALTQFAAGGQSVREFCAARRLKETAFYFWRREIQRRDGRAPARRQRSTPRPAAFARVLVQPPITPAAEADLRLRLGAGRELLLPASWPVQRVAALLRAIEDAA
jgi:transposase-like protein